MEGISASQGECSPFKEPRELDSTMTWNDLSNHLFLPSPLALAVTTWASMPMDEVFPEDEAASNEEEEEEEEGEGG